MKNRQNLHDSGLALIFVGILNLFMLCGSFIGPIFDGTFTEAMATVEPDMLGAVNTVLMVIAALMVLLAVADMLLGIKALKVSKAPSTKKGYIVVAMVFLFMSVISTISHINSLSNGNAPVVEVVLNMISSALNVCIYVLFIKSAIAVRSAALITKK